MFCQESAFLCVSFKKLSGRITRRGSLTCCKPIIQRQRLSERTGGNYRHLVNTFLLLASITLTAWWASDGQAIKLPRGDTRLLWFGQRLLAILFLGASGTITALGDTLFPVSSLLDRR